MTVSISVVYHSGFGHTAKVAEAIVAGAKSNGVHVDLINVETITDAEWDKLDQANAIIFGAPTYMGSVSAQFKTFMDASSKKWADGKWKDKIAAGFTNSASYSGDKQVALQQLITFAMQHRMVWVGQGELPPMFAENDMPDADKINRLGSFSGLMTQSNHLVSADIVPGKGDLETSRIFGARIADIASRLSPAKAA